MKTPEQIIQEAKYAVASINTGYLMLIKWKSKQSHTRACRLINSGESKLRSLQTEAGRLKKKMKRQKKYTKVVTLTEVLGKPWRILVKK